MGSVTHTISGVDRNFVWEEGSSWLKKITHSIYFTLKITASRYGASKEQLLYTTKNYNFYIDN